MVVSFEAAELKRLDFNQSYFMLDSPGYWGAYQPVLEWLKNQELNDVPMAESLISGRNLIPPDYLNSLPISVIVDI